MTDESPFEFTFTPKDLDANLAKHDIVPEGRAELAAAVVREIDKIIIEAVRRATGEDARRIDIRRLYSLRAANIDYVTYYLDGEEILVMRDFDYARDCRMTFVKGTHHMEFDTYHRFVGKAAR